MLIACSFIQFAVLALLPISNVWANLFIKKTLPVIGVGVAIAGFLDEISVKLKLYDRTITEPVKTQTEEKD